MKHKEDGASSQVHAGPNPVEGKEASMGSTSNQRRRFNCNISLKLAQDPMMTLYKHLFCWACC